MDNHLDRKAAMSNTRRLRDLGITLTEPVKSLANYAPYQIVDRMIYVSGQLPLENGILTHTGKLGDTVSLEEGQAAARRCAVNILAHLKSACEGDLDKVERCIRLGGFVNCTPDFTDHSKVINGASDLIVAVLANPGRHARAAIGTNSLPLGASVEIEGLFLLK